jgi:hypothetical protein
MNENSYNAVKKMRALIAEGLVGVSAESCRDAVMTLYLSDGDNAYDESFSLALPPFAYYSDFGVAMRYLSSVGVYSKRAFAALGSVKDDSVKLNAILKMVDYMYTEEGMALVNLGGGVFCDGFIASTLANELCDSLSSGDYVAFLGDYVGALSGESSYISFGDTHSAMFLAVDKYISLGVIKVNNMLFEDDYPYTFVPKIHLTDYNEHRLSELTEITSEDGEFSFANEKNIFVKLLLGENVYHTGYADVFLDEMGGREYVTILRRAMGSLKTYYHAYLYS